MQDGAVKASAHQKDGARISRKPIYIIDINTPSHEGNHTFKILRRQLKDGRTKNDKLKKENLEA
jgi:hypothetical protein